MLNRSSVLIIIMRAQYPDHGTILQVNPSYNEKLVVLNCLDGGQNRAAWCQVLPGGNSTGNKTKESILLLNQTFRRGQQNDQGDCVSASVGLHSRASAGQISLARAQHVSVCHRVSGGRQRSPGLRTGTRSHPQNSNMIHKVKKEKSLYTSTT